MKIILTTVRATLKETKRKRRRILKINKRRKRRTILKIMRKRRKMRSPKRSKRKAERLRSE